VALWDAPSRRRLRKLGHSAGGEAACALGFSPCAGVAFSCAPGDRAVALWPAQQGDAKAKKALARLPLPTGEPLQLRCAAAGGAALAAGDFLLACVSRTGEAFLWLLSAEGQPRGAPHALQPSAAQGRGGDCVLAAACTAETQGAPSPRRLLPTPVRTVLFSVAG
jgi:hypothetical protein